MLTTDDPPSVLVAYATRFGSTREIAEHIARRLAEHGAVAAVLDTREDLDPAAFDAVVFGGAVFDRRWPPEGEAYLRAHADVLARRPVWLFTVGSFGDEGRLSRRWAPREPSVIGEIRRAIRPRDYRVFAGVIDRARWPVWSRWLFRALGGRFGDARDWPAIDAWADRIAQAVGAGQRAGVPSS